MSGDLGTMRHEWSLVPGVDWDGEQWVCSCGKRATDGGAVDGLCTVRVAEALDAAHADGRRAGLLEAADIAEHPGYASERGRVLDALAAAIRRLAADVK